MIFTIQIFASLEFLFESVAVYHLKYVLFLFTKLLRF
jgi:hypothetical protein